MAGMTKNEVVKQAVDLARAFNRDLLEAKRGDRDTLIAVQMWRGGLSGYIARCRRLRAHNMSVAREIRALPETQVFGEGR